MKSIISLLITVILLAGCSRSLDSKIEDMVAAKNQWQEVSYGRAYRFDLETQIGPSRVSRSYEAMPGRDSLSQADEVTSIKALFNAAFDSLKDSESEVDVKYDEQYGYPVEVSITKPNRVDANMTITVKALMFVEDASMSTAEK
ncbi:DUF6174 domain-containing protein [Hahella ganghwensis]|uniref:DUF6174 domain-containing protein n=1 Tax=Hahella ganghwensis TaxID=286420 RepID=UPI00036BC03B|nr:DUF6174 domain-containing protein [Hahella ganghwensis]